MRHANATEEPSDDDDMMNLCTLVEKSPDADLLREMIGFAARRLMELEVEGQTGAAFGEKNLERLAQRNSYHDRIWETRAGAVELRIRAAQRLLLPGLPGATPKPWCRKLTCRVSRRARWMIWSGDGDDRHLQKPVSRLCGEIDEVKAFLGPPIEGNWP
ncbi:mutator family transposase [Bradyrhizobium macuxiense]|uniref:Mutator family transposase n=1 Tax=Bradyrhizobium macuxiense TaxID=1755647 RepID=A0A560KU87_9BRAD|nr:mutator family transposase [Bradyrhizobium macuxiense]